MFRLFPGNTFPQVVVGQIPRDVEVYSLLQELSPQVRGDLFSHRLSTEIAQFQSTTIGIILLECCPLGVHSCLNPLDLFEWRTLGATCAFAQPPTANSTV